MNIESKLTNLKIDYLKIEPSTSFLNNGWKNLSNHLEPRKTHKFWLMWRWSFTTATLVLLLIAGSIFGLFQGAKAALPGDRLYPLKRISENVISKTQGNDQIKVENRAHEIIGLVKEKQKDQQAIDKTVKEYQENVNKVTEQIKQPEKQQEFEKKVEEHKQEFQKLSEENPEIEKDLHEITQRKTEDKQEEVKKESEKSSEED